MFSNCVLLSDVYLLENNAILVFNQGFRLRTRPLVSSAIGAYDGRRLAYVNSRELLEGTLSSRGTQVEGKLTSSGFVLHRQPFEDISKRRFADIH